MKFALDALKFKLSTDKRPENTVRGINKHFPPKYLPLVFLISFFMNNKKSIQLCDYILTKKYAPFFSHKVQILEISLNNTTFQGEQKFSSPCFLDIKECLFYSTVIIHIKRNQGNLCYQNLSTSTIYPYPY